MLAQAFFLCNLAQLPTRNIDSTVISCYLTVNTLRLRYKDQPPNAL
jgi:hypothetical protein